MLQVLCKSWSLFCIFSKKKLIIVTFFEIIWAFAGPTFYFEASQADVWQCGEEIALASDGEPGAGANEMSSVRSLLSYTESATFTRLSPPR